MKPWALRLAAIALLTPVAMGSEPEPLTPPEYRRGVEQTFLTYPEWFLVHSPAEYADWLKGRRPSDFPFLGHVRQFWKGYAAVARATRERRDPPNAGYHLMIAVIGVSTTVEYGLKSAYEVLVGRPAEILRGEHPTSEERLAARTAQEYVDFIRVRPWYEFDFNSRLRRLWSETGLLGPDLLRKCERKFALTSEYLAKAAYGWLIGRATHAAYESEATVTAAVLSTWPEAGRPGLELLARRPDGSALVTLPRYAAFTEHAVALAREGVGFREIAGNRAAILVSVLLPAKAALPVGTTLVLREPILTRPGTERLVLCVPVSGLSKLLGALPAEASVEHVYDY